MQAVLLGLAATISHTAIVWIIALAGLHFGAQWNTEATEPYLQIVSAVMILALPSGCYGAHGEIKRAMSTLTATAMKCARSIFRGGVVTLEIFEDGVPPVRRIRSSGKELLAPDRLSLETIRPDGARQRFAFMSRDGYLKSFNNIPEPHAFAARLRLGHGNHTHDYEVEFHEHVETAGPSGTREYSRRA